MRQIETMFTVDRAICQIHRGLTGLSDGVVRVAARVDELLIVTVI